MRRGAAAALAALALAGAGMRAAAETRGPACLVSVSLDPPAAVVGQQVLHVTRILRRPDVTAAQWLTAPAFPSLRAEWLPGRVGDTRVWQDGTPYLVFEERRALFPVRAGRLELPGGRLLCELHAFPGEPRRAEEAAVAPAVLEVAELPREGRPPGFGGLVGSVSVRRALDPPSIALGGALRLRIVLEGMANLWDAPPPVPVEDADVELFPHPPELLLDASERLAVRRIFVWDLVPRRAGTLRLGALEVASFDPASGRFVVAAAPPVEAEVRPAAAAAPPAEPRAGGGGRARPEAGVPPPLGVGTIAGLCALVAAAGVAVAAVVRRRRRATARRARADGVAPARAPAAGAARDRDPHALAEALEHALREALAERAPSLRDASADALASAARGDAALAEPAALLARLERARFARGAERIDDAAAREVIERLRRSAGRGAR